MASHYQFSVVPGVFEAHAEIAKSSADNQVRTQPKLGLIHQKYGSAAPDDAGLPQWTRFGKHLAHLNETSPDGESYKLIYVVRHGRAVHNEVMSEVGDDWRKTGPKWAFLEGGNIPDIGEVTWVDAKLVDTGVEDAEALSRFWLDATENYSMPLPDTIYTSPLARCLETTKLTYQNVMGANGKPFQPVVKELLREWLTGHTCDKRSSKSWIAENYPEYVLEEGFEEDDRLWEEKRDPAEELDELTARTQRLLEDIFTSDSSQFIAFTTHSYSIHGLQEVVGCKHYRVGEGVMVPLLVKGVKI